MASGWRYRVTGVGGTIAFTTLAIAVANLPVSQTAITALPVLRNLNPVTLQNGALLKILVITLVVIVGALWPLFKPQPRRILDTITLTEKRLFIGTAALAAIGYFDRSSALPRSTLAVIVLLLVVFLPFWFLVIRRRPAKPTRAVLVGDSPDRMEKIYAAADVPIIGYVSPPTIRGSIDQAHAAVSRTDGGSNAESGFHSGGRFSYQDTLSCLGGLSRLDEVLVEYDVDTALLAFGEPDRAEFFGVLTICYEHGVSAIVHREYASSVLLAGSLEQSDLITIDLDPWDIQDRILKRLFDVAFALSGLVVLFPVMVAIAVAIKIDSPGPVLYSQERTAEFGNTFRVYKFRSMRADAEAETGPTLSEEDRDVVDPRVTRVGRVLRQTHLDEIPQLWSILVGHMSVVGPRPERPELDTDIETAVETWQRRWFIRPGLTGLAQIRGATGYEPAKKLEYDIEYIQNQSFWFDLKIVVRQLWQVLAETVEFVTSSQSEYD